VWPESLFHGTLFGGLDRRHQHMFPLDESSYMPYSADLRIGRGRVLVLAPHPDDEVLGCAGAIMRHVEDGDPVQVHILTDGALGAPGETADIIVLRESESRAAATILGYGEPVFWRWPDRGLSRMPDLSDRLAEVIREFRPDWIYAPSWWEIHPDHAVLSRAVTMVFGRGGFAAWLVLYEVGVPLQPNHLLDITDYLERKKQAMHCFASQLAQQAYDSHILALNRFRTYTLPASVLAAEAYRVVHPSELPPDPANPRLARIGP
jgi:LmbE family N-acetylglucosaminyl deacetylase